MNLFKSITLDNDLIQEIRLLLNKLQISTIDTIQVYNVKGTKQVMLNYYFSSEWASGIQMIFYVVDNKLKFQSYGKFGWRDEKYHTVSNQKKIDDFIITIENVNIK